MSPGTYLGWKIDFRHPAGEPAFTGPESVSWRVFKNPVALAIGGAAAVVLEFADARIRSGVWDHSTFAADPVGRAKRTGIAAMVGVYGPQSAARRVIQGVTNMHGRVGGLTPTGEAYRALDPDLLDWVSATATYGFVSAYDRFVEPLSAEEKDRFCAEGAGVGALYGAPNPIRSIVDFEVMLADRLDRFEPHPIITEFLSIMASGRAAPGVPRGLQSALVHAAVSLVPPEVRARLKLGPGYALSPRGAAGVRLMARTADRIPNLSGPAAQACERLGLPRNYLWTARSRRKSTSEIPLS